MKHDLHSPLNLRHITLPGRVVRASTELFCATPGGFIHPYEYEVYRELSDKGLGMILSAHTCVSAEGHANPYQNALWSDDHTDETAKLIRIASAHGTPVVMQLGHGGYKAEGNNNGLPVFTADTMTENHFGAVAAAFGRAAQRAKSAGASGVELHGAHLYLLSQCFYPEINHRTDRFGGCAENRFRLIRMCYEAVRETCGDDFPVFLKINGDDRENTEDYHRDLVDVLNLCDTLGMDAAEISGWDSARRGIPPAPYFLDNIRRLKTETALPLIAVGGIRSGDDMDALFDAGASAVSMARPFLQDPDVVRKIEQGGRSCCTGCCSCFKPLNTTDDPIIRCPYRARKGV